MDAARTARPASVAQAVEFGIGGTPGWVRVRASARERRGDGPRRKPLLRQSDGRREQGRRHLRIWQFSCLFSGCGVDGCVRHANTSKGLFRVR